MNICNCYISTAEGITIYHFYLGNHALDCPVYVLTSWHDNVYHAALEGEQTRKQLTPADHERIAAATK